MIMNTRAEYYGEITKALIQCGHIKGARYFARIAARAALAYLRETRNCYVTLSFGFPLTSGLRDLYRFEGNDSGVIFQTAKLITKHGGFSTIYGA